jgi:TDG/mug DNA glycosylase family protein
MSIAAEQYYANPGNDFWKLIGAVLNQTFTGLSYEDKIELLRANRIGLWDAFQTCVRPGSMDSEITEHELNEFTTLKAIAPKIRLICFNGRKAAQAEASLHALGYETRILPSSSGANRRVQKGRLVSWKTAIQFVATDFNNRLPPS